jgi:hypothetical protein
MGMGIDKRRYRQNTPITESDPFRVLRFGIMFGDLNDLPFFYEQVLIY